MPDVIIGVTIDCNDPTALAPFWAEALGFHPSGDHHDPSATFLTLMSPSPEGLHHLTLQRVPEPKTGKARIHLDVFVSDLHSELERLVALGATVLAPADPAAEWVTAVLADPEGHEFCLVQRAPAAAPTPGPTNLATNPVVIHWAHDMDAAIEFYRSALGLTVVTTDPYLSVLELEPIQLLLHIIEHDRPERPLPHAGLNVQVTDLDEAIERITRQGGTVDNVLEATAGIPIRVAACRDPDGNAFEIRQPVV